MDFSRRPKRVRAAFAQRVAQQIAVFSEGRSVAWWPFPRFPVAKALPDKPAERGRGAGMRFVKVEHGRIGQRDRFARANPAAREDAVRFE